MVFLESASAPVHVPMACNVHGLPSLLFDCRDEIQLV